MIIVLWALVALVVWNATNLMVRAATGCVTWRYAWTIALGVWAAGVLADRDRVLIALGTIAFGVCIVIAIWAARGDFYDEQEPR